MIEYIRNVPEKYSEIYKRSENDVSKGQTIDQLIRMVNDSIKAANLQTKRYEDIKNRKYDNPVEINQIKLMKKRDQILKQNMFKMHFNKM
jgi:hypothetical protein